MMILFIASVALLILTFRKPRKVSVLSLIITIAVSLITLVIFSSLIKYEPPPWLWLLMFAIGTAVGWFWARTTKVFVQGNQVMSRNSIWYLVVWGAIFALNQLIIIVTKRPPDIAMAMLIISSATIWGINGNVMRRYFQIKTSLKSTEALAEQPYIVNASPSQASIAGMAEKAVSLQHIAGYCPQCGTAFKKDAAFCMKCGIKL
jgi:hypothetical protein